MLQTNDCKVVVCRDGNCKLCSTANMENMNEQAYIVYTCESTNCKLCREETDVLLDLFCPFNTVEDIAEMTRKLNNITETPWSLFNYGVTATTELQAYDIELGTSDEENAVPNLQHPNLDISQMVRAMLQSTPGQMKDKQGLTNLEIIQNLQPVDDNLLTDLERELEVDQLEDLPELIDICDLMTR